MMEVLMRSASPICLAGTMQVRSRPCAWSTGRSNVRHGSAPAGNYFNIKSPIVFVFVSLLLFYFPGDSQAQLTSDISFSIDEGRPPETLVGTIPVTVGSTYRFSTEQMYFSIHSTSGEIRTTTEIDREELDSDVFDLSVLEIREGSGNIPIEVRIVVKDINDNPPMFSESETEKSLSESASIGARVLLPSATDPDLGLNGTVSNFEIVSGNVNSTFELQFIQFGAGILRLVLREKLDRERTDFYQLRIKVTDQGSPSLSSFLVVNLSVSDVNDNAPVFELSEYRFSLNESAMVGTEVLQVTATDLDVGRNGEIMYSFRQPNSHFAVDPLTGVVTLISKLVYEAESYHSFKLEARDQGVPSQQGRTDVFIEVIDINDHDPHIAISFLLASDSYASVEEGAPINSVIAIVTVTDADQGDNGAVNLVVVEGNELGHFQLLSIPSLANIFRVSVVGMVDREVVPEYNLTFQAEDMGIPRRRSIATIRIVVLDANDHSPEFVSDTYSATITENVPVGSFVESLSASDQDTGENAEISYTISSGNDLGWFQIDVRTGLVTTASALDRETASVLTLTVTATDHGRQPLTTSVELMVTISDVNDVVPLFSNETYHAIVIENAEAGVEVVTVYARDEDEGSGGLVAYSFADDSLEALSMFAIDSQSGLITTLMSLDREEVSEIVLSVKAKDLGQPSLFSMAMVNVIISDVNDNSPVFYPEEYFVSVDENEAAPAPVVTVSATDADTNINGRVTYFMIDNNGENFQINTNTGEIVTTRALDRETQSHFTILVSALDGGGNEASRPATVYVTVADIQDNPPIFRQTSYTFQILENVMPNSFVGVVSASSEDLEVNITYRIFSGDPEGHFKIHPETGEIRTRTSIDRETMPSYDLVVYAHAASLTGNVAVRIMIGDINDNAPSFSAASASVDVVVDWSIGHQFYQAQAFDSDVSPNSLIAYELTVNPGSFFSIDPMSGWVYIDADLKTALQNDFTLEVRATDSGTPPLASTLTLFVRLRDVNNHSPVFQERFYSVSIGENTQPTVRFIQVEAVDADNGSNGMVTYNITAGNDEEKFGIFPDGQVYVKDNLDRETTSEYQLTITASDHGVPPRSSVASLAISLEDINDNSPDFLNATYDFYIREEEASPIVGMVEAIDRDVGLNGEVTYSIVTNQTYFQIGSRNGLISSDLVFDREQQSVDSFSLEVEASDSGNNSLSERINVNIHITDINDNSPIFMQSEYHTSISELAPIGANVIIVSAADHDIGDNSFVTYSITSGNSENRFSINHASGQISVANALDRESFYAYTLVIKAEDAGTPPLTATANVYLTILDENDHRPVFQDTNLAVEITECVQIDDLVTSMFAFDEDIGQNSLISYSIVGGNSRGIFYMDPNSGNLHLAKLLDHETDAEYHLNVSAQDSGSPPLSGFASVVITVRDCNDNAPTFSQSLVVREINEELSAGTEVVTVVAQDFDSGINGQVVYSILTQEPNMNFFQIDPATGTISVQTPIDLEALPPSSQGLVQLTVQAIDQALPVDSRQSATTSVTFIVRDINDNRPEIISQSATTVSPSSSLGTQVTSVVAVDRDSGNNAKVTFSLISGGLPFAINSTSGLVTVSGIISPSASPYSLLIRVEDGGSPPLSSQITLSIIVTEVQSTGPFFSQNSYSAELEENQPVGTPVITVSASYANGRLATVEYYITSISLANMERRNYFSIERSSGLISTSVAIDREAFVGEPVITLVVTAADVSAVPPRTRDVQVLIRIEDVNDNPPVFQDSLYNTSVSEDANPGTLVLTVLATDADSSQLSDIRYSITSGSDSRFAIDSSSGRITLEGALDRETKDGYMLTVEASDGALFSASLVAIRILDQNDNSPVFTDAVYSFQVAEDAEALSVIDRISANDLDEGSNGVVRYQVVEEGAPGETTFSLDAVTGEVSLLHPVDFEEKQLYYLKVQASDQGFPSLTSTSTVYISILDVNDNTPEFSPVRYSVEVSESVTVGSHLTTVYASDADSGPNAMIQYSIQSGDTSNRFAILPNGTVVIAQPLNREGQSFYNMEIRGEDSPVDSENRRYGTAQVSVIVLDINDNAPTFTSPSEVHILESAIPGTLVMTVIAEDPDVERNSYVEYSLDPVPGEAFIIGRDNGNLFVWSYLDRESQPSFNLTVIATDKGTPAQSSMMVITVILDDVNDNNPIFDETEYHVVVPENIPVGVEYLEVSATDPDLGSNAWITYTIEDGNYNSDFAIDVQTGVLSVAKTLDHERRQSYTLTIRAQDSGPGSRFSRCSVVVEVEDVNDNYPIFLDTYRPVITENNLPGEVVIQVAADDLDQGANGDLTYSLQGNTYGSLFTIDRATGVIRVTERVDHEDAVDYSLTVVAEDAGTPQLMGMTEVIIRVADANDHQPQFLSDAYSTTIEEEVPLNTEVLRVVATDIDSSAMLRYRLDGDVGNKFTIYPFTGHIVTAGRLDREEKAYYELIVTVTDSEERTASARVFITVTDIDDNEPQFVATNYEVTLPENANAGTLVTVVSAVDIDTDVNAASYYTIEGGDASIFSIDHATGAITVSQNLSDQTEEYTLQVGVRGAADGEIADYATVHIMFQFKLLMSYPTINLLGRTQITLSENQPIGEVLVVHADSPKTGSAGQVTFHFAGGNEENYFALQSETGNLTLQKILDYEMQNSFHLWVEARDGDNPPLSSFSDIIISVLDLNDNAPVFEKEEYSDSIGEGITSAQEVLQVVAHDKDSGIYGDIRYSIRSETNPNNAFRIDDTSGVITTTRVLDREVRSSYQLTVEAVDFGSPAKSGTTVVIIEVEDINDNAMFTTDTFEGSVEENAAVGTFVMKVATQDADIGPNAVSRFRIISGNTRDAFTIGELSGDITVNRALDREATGGSQYQLVVQAFDEFFTFDIPVTIDVLDVNDNSPVFSENRYEVQIPELQPEGTFVAAVNAGDRDEGDNSRIRYQLKALGGVFHLDPITGHITIGEVLEYKRPNNVFTENPNIYQFSILAVDYGFPTLYSEVPVIVEVFDANDHPPVFDASSYFSPIPAGTLQGVEVVRVHAEDNLDQGANAEVNYFIEGGNGTSHFEVDEETGWVKVLGNFLEGSVGTRYSLMIRAQDKGRPTPLSSTTQVDLLITSANIHTPQFSAGSLTTSVREDHLPGLIGTLVATDQDSGVNGRITYSIVSGNGQGMFSVDELSGDIYLEKELDYETESSYTLKINATDGGWEELTTTALFVVNVADVDDNPPVFQQSEYFASVPENTPSAQYVTSVVAVDIDSEMYAQFTYSIIGGDGQNYFTINELEGSIWTQGRLDYEQGQQTFELTVAATNQDGSQRDITHVHIEVTGVNEFSPQFLHREYDYSVSEGAPDGALVGSVLAVDSDAGLDGKVVYILIGASNDVGFAINSETGQIIVSKENGILDRETQEEVVLSVLAKNEGPLTGSNIDQTTVTIHIVDANDAPVFSPEYYTATVREDAQPHTYITTVTATEYDQQPAFRQFIYTFREDTDHDVFAIDEITGRITVRGALDRETTAVYHLTVAAVDSGSPPMTGTAEVEITVEDVNDNGPVLVGSNAEGRVAENQAPNTYVMTLNATDPDANSNPLSFRYRLSPVSDAFTLDDFSGELRTIKTLDREEQSEYFLQVEISDGGSPLMTSTSTLRIIVEDQNDQLSSSRNARIEVKMYQSNFVGGPIGVTRPIDGDLSDDYECEIISGDLRRFSIEPGCVLYAGPQTQEGQYTVNISGSDGHHPPVLSSFAVIFQAYDNDTLDASITITVTDITAEDFLRQRYDQFLAAMSTILPSREELIILSLTDIDDSTLGVLLAVKRRNGYTSKENLIRLFEDNRDSIETRAGIIIETIDYSACGSYPCLNQGTCRNQHTVDFTPMAVESIPVIFVAPVSEHTFMCECASEYDGQYCENHINHCESEPCMNGAVCNDLIGDYACQCVLGFTGKQCQINIDDCARNPCRNGGICADLINGYRCECLVGYSGDNCEDGPCALNPCMNGALCVESGSEFSCQCPFGYWGTRCEFLSIGFLSGSFMEFPSLAREENSVIIEFSTTLPQSLLVYSHDGTTSENGHFFVLEVKDGKVHFSFNLGAGVVSMATERRVDDGNWHRVQAIRKAQNGELFILDEECNFLPEQACRATRVSSSFSQVELLLNGTPFFLGGVDSLDQLTLRPWQASSADFVGCMRQITVNGQNLDIQSATRSIDVTEGCDRQPTICYSATCGDEGICVDEWWDSWCQCQEGATGESCDQEPSPSSFGGDGFIEYHIKESYRRQQLLNQAQEGRRRRRATTPQIVSLSFRTGSTDGILLFIKSDEKFTLLEVEDSMVRYSFGTGDYSQGTILFDSVLVNDWVWHNVTLEMDGKSLSLKVDDSGKTRDFNLLPHDFTGLNVVTLNLGGSASDVEIDGEVLEGFSGCITGFEFGGEPMPFSGANERFNVVPSENVGSGCSRVDVCSSKPCASVETCVPEGQSFTCVPQPCLSSPCLNDGTCYARGNAFICSCADGFIGDYCEIISPQTTTGDPSTSVIIISVIAVVVLCIILLVVIAAVLLRRRWNNKPKSQKPQNGVYVTNGTMDNPSFINNDTFDDATMIGYHDSKISEDHLSSMQRQPDIIDQNVQSSAVPSSSSPEVDKVEDITHGDSYPEHYDIENASSIAPSDIDVAYHYRHYHDREGRRKKHRRSPNPMLARIQASPSRESPLSITRQSPHPFIGRTSPSIFGNGTPVPHPAYRHSPNIMVMQTMDGGVDIRRAASPYRDRNIPTPVGSEHSELRSLAHRSDVSSVRSGRTGRTKSPMSGVSVPSHRSKRSNRAKTPVSVKSEQPTGLTAEEVARLNSARPDLMSGSHSHTSTIDNLSSVSDDANMNNLNQPTLLEPPDSSSDESAASFTCSEMEPDIDVDTGTYIMTRLASIDNLNAPQNGRLDSDGGSQRTPFSSEDENGSKGPESSNGHFSLDQLLNWGPSFQNLSPVCRDIALLNDLNSEKKTPKLQLDANINGEEFV